MPTSRRSPKLQKRQLEEIEQQKKWKSEERTDWAYGATHTLFELANNEFEAMGALPTGPASARMKFETTAAGKCKENFHASTEAFVVGDEAARLLQAAIEIYGETPFKYFNERTIAALVQTRKGQPWDDTLYHIDMAAFASGGEDWLNYKAQLSSAQNAYDLVKSSQRTIVVVYDEVCDTPREKPLTKLVPRQEPNTLCAVAVEEEDITFQQTPTHATEGTACSQAALEMLNNTKPVAGSGSGMQLNSTLLSSYCTSPGFFVRIGDVDNRSVSMQQKFTHFAHLAENSFGIMVQSSVFRMSSSEATPAYTSGSIKNVPGDPLTILVKSNLMDCDPAELKALLTAAGITPTQANTQFNLYSPLYTSQSKLVRDKLGAMHKVLVTLVGAIDEKELLEDEDGALHTMGKSLYAFAG